MCLCVCVIDEWRGAGMSPVSTCSLFRCSRKYCTNNNRLSFFSFPLLWVCGVQTSRAKCPVSWLTTADSQALLEGLALSDSSWSLLIRTVKLTRFTFCEYVCVFVCVRLRERKRETDLCTVCIYVCICVYSSLVR